VFIVVLSTVHPCISQSISLYRLSEAGNEKYCYDFHARGNLRFISPTHKRTEGRAPCGALSLLQKDAALQGGYSRIRCRLNVKLRTSVTA